MKIGNMTFEKGLFLAPMAGITDMPFRKLCRKYSAEGVFTEMISSRAVCYGDEKTKKLATIDSQEHPCFLQLFGNSPEIMEKAAMLVMEFSPDAIDINMGCPAPKIAGNGDGSALMKNPLLAYEIVKGVKRAVQRYSIPVTVKIRSGFDRAHINAVEVARAVCEAGADAITVHARTREQMYAPPVDMDIIRQVKQSVAVPVIGNGDIVDAKSALFMLEYTGCDGIMIGRGALGNPYIFDEISHAMLGKKYIKPSKEAILEDIIEHMTLLVEHKGEYTGSREARKHIAWYLKGMQGAAAFRDEVNKATSLEKILDIARKAFS